MDLIKKDEELSVLRKFQNVQNVKFEILNVDEAKKTFVNYSGENPDFIIKIGQEYFGVELFKLCPSKSESKISYGGQVFVNPEHKRAKYPNKFDTLEELDSHINKIKMNPEMYPFEKQDRRSFTLKELIFKKIEKSSNYIPPKNWLIGYANEIYQTGLVEDIFRHKVEEAQKREIANIFREQSTSIKKVFLFEYNTGHGEFVFECDV